MLVRYTLPTLVISVVFHAATGFLQYGQAMKRNGMIYYFACTVNAVIASVGLWCLLFATDRGHISRKVCVIMNSELIAVQTGFDHVSAHIDNVDLYFLLTCSELAAILSRT